jgi:hypothetical protein
VKNRNLVFVVPGEDDNPSAESSRTVNNRTVEENAASDAIVAALF